MQKLINDDLPIEIPPIECGQYLLDVLYEVGPVMHGGMGETPLTHGEIAAWSSLIGIELKPFEVRVLRRLSMEYLAQSQQSTKPECPPPFGPIAHRAAVAKKIDEFFG